MQLMVEKDMEVLAFQKIKEQVSQNNRGLVSRIKAQMLKKGLNPKTLAEKANVGRSFVYDILNGKSNNPTSSKLAAIATQLEVSVQYLLTGVHGGVGADGQSNAVEIQVLTVESTPNGIVVATAENANQPYLFDSKWLSEKLNATEANLRAITVAGDSMSPTLNEGDTILINTSQTTLSPAGLFVIFDGLGLHAKRLEVINKDKVRVISDNNQYTAYEMNMAELNIIGRVVWMARGL
jgi:phage repressor protein C with HTH and peptisase S24 domain